MDAADKAGKLDSAAGYAATRGLLAEAARLKLLTAPRATPPRPPRSVAKPLTHAQWLARFGPKPTAAA
jgi:hypothetical protein